MNVELIAENSKGRFAKKVKAMLDEHPDAEVHYSFAWGSGGNIFTAMILWTDE